jgi:hypothetical protein
MYASSDTDTVAYSYLLTGKPGNYTINTLAEYNLYGESYNIENEASVAFSKHITQFNVTQDMTTDLYVGEVIGITYTLTNDEDVPINNIAFTLPLQTGVGLTKKSITYDRLQPHTSVELSNYAHIMQTNVSVPGFDVYYQKNGKLYVISVDAQNLSVDSTRSAGPILEPTLHTTIREDNTYNHRFNIKNRGKQKAIIDISDNDFSVDAGDFTEIQFEAPVDRTSQFELSYDFVGKRFYTGFDVAPLENLSVEKQPNDDPAPQPNRRPHDNVPDDQPTEFKPEKESSSWLLWIILIILGVVLIGGAVVLWVFVLHTKEVPPDDRYLTESDKHHELPDVEHVDDDQVGKVT